MDIKKNIILSFFIIAAVLFEGSVLTSTRNKMDPADTHTYTLGYMKDLFYELDINDAEAALKVWANEIVKKYYTSDRFQLNVKIYDNLKEMEAGIKQDNLAIISLSTNDYLNYSSRLGLEPICAPLIDGEPGVEYEILVRKESNYKSIKDLKGKALGVISSPVYMASQLWLDVILAKEKLPAKAKYFAKISGSQKESQLILNLFFGNLDVCVVSKSSFKLMKELNPQVGVKVTSILSSPVYMAGFLCYTKAADNPSLKKRINESMTKLHESTYGKQIFTLLKINDLTPFKYEYLNTYRDLLRDHNKLVASTKTK